MAPVDLRSDTVTQPTAEMREAMAEAEVGDDVYGEDPTVNRLQERVAELLGKEAALFVPSGTMGNQIAIRLLTAARRRGAGRARAATCAATSSRAWPQISGVMPRMVDAPGGHLTADHVRAAVTPRRYYTSDVSLVVVENSHNLGGGTVQVVDGAARRGRRRQGVRLPGPPRRGAHLERGRGARRGAGDAHRGRRHGDDVSLEGAVRAGGLAAGARRASASRRRTACARCSAAACARRVSSRRPGSYALETLVPRLAEDHANARLLGAALGRCRGVRLAPVETNMAVGVLEGQSAPDAVAALAREGRAGDGHGREHAAAHHAPRRLPRRLRARGAGDRSDARLTPPTSRFGAEACWAYGFTTRAVLTKSSFGNLARR